MEKEAEKRGRDSFLDGRAEKRDLTLNAAL